MLSVFCLSQDASWLRRSPRRRKKSRSLNRGLTNSALCTRGPTLSLWWKWSQVIPKTTVVVQFDKLHHYQNYEKVVYKAKVVTGFKGSHPGEVFYFGPFVGERLSTGYLLFLLDTHKELAPKKGKGTGYGSVHYWEVFNQGLTLMETSYECVFEGKEPAASCDYGVRICTDHIKLPRSMPAFPPEENDPPFRCRWVRKNVFTSFLESLASSHP